MKTKFNFTEVKSTEKAILANIEGIEMWLPKSVCEIEGDMIEVAEWKAREINGKIESKAKMAAENAKMAAKLGITVEEAIERHYANPFHNYDKRRGEYYAIDSITGKRFYA